MIPAVKKLAQAKKTDRFQSLMPDYCMGVLFFRAAWCWAGGSIPFLLFLPSTRESRRMSLSDKKGCAFEVRLYTPEDSACLSRMYDRFTPKAKFQGMPPFSKAVRETWLRQLVEKGHNFLAWSEAAVIGHVVILPDFNIGDAEYLIFVDQGHRGMGVGMALTLAALDKARDLDLKKVWLTVDAYNFRAIRLYRKAGFIPCEGYQATTERMMGIDLTKEMET
jgi:RimJ/RimL family protein N-acetyltransferase